MNALADTIQDVMQVCRNGHVITDRLRGFPERALPHCDRCGATTLERCQTCGKELPGALVVPGLHPVGVRQPPCYCPTCGVAFPWTLRRQPSKRAALNLLEAMLRRVPRVIRQLRSRHGERPPFRVVDEHDLEDLLRSLLPLHFDDIRPECRTPSYAADTRTDFLLAPEGIAVTIKQAQSNLIPQVQEDRAYYQRERKCRTLVVFIHDPEGVLRESPVLEDACGEEPEVRCVIGAF